MAVRLQHTILFLLLFGLADETYADCWEEASGRYNVPVTLLKAIAEVESSNRARVVAVNTNGTQDYGFMQINDFWLPTLKRYGIGVDELMDPCTSLNVGAWILAQNIRQMGYGWEAVGAYGAGTRKDKAAAGRSMPGRCGKCWINDPSTMHTTVVISVATLPPCVLTPNPDAQITVASNVLPCHQS